MGFYHGLLPLRFATQSTAGGTAGSLSVSAREQFSLQPRVALSGQAPPSCVAHWSPPIQRTRRVGRRPDANKCPCFPSPHVCIPFPGATSVAGEDLQSSSQSVAVLWCDGPFYLTETNDDKTFVDIDSAAARIEYFHSASSSFLLLTTPCLRKAPARCRCFSFLLRASRWSDKGWFTQAPWYILTMEQTRWP